MVYPRIVDAVSEGYTRYQVYDSHMGEGGQARETPM